MVPFMPLYALGAALGARFLAGRLRVPRLWWVALVVLMAPSVVMALRAGHLEAGTLRDSLAAERAGLSNLALGDSTRLVFSDTPDFVAWTTGVPTVWVSRDEFDALYGGDGERARRLGLPAHGEVATWFHDDPRDPSGRGRPHAPPVP
jgi:hypothetical protein